jgi:hypothetical protein
MAEEYESKPIIDQYLNFECALKRLDLILAAEMEADAGSNNEAWRQILADEAFKVFEDLSQVRDDIKEKFAVDEYMEWIKTKYAVEAEEAKQPHALPI